MFERFTIPARQAIFAAHHEASIRNSHWIDTEHLLFGLFYSETSIQNISEGLREPGPDKELPLTTDAQQALAYAAEEADSLGSSSIEIRHLVLGLLRLPECAAARSLNRLGVTYETYRGSEPLLNLAAVSISEPIATLNGLIESATENLIYTDEYGDQRLKRKPWSRKEALGHLIDLATAHHHWFARALAEPILVAGAPVSPEWIAAQDYGDYSWTKLIDLWISLNQLLLHVLSKIPEAKLATCCRIGIEPPVALKDLVVRYVAYCDDIMGQIFAHL